MSNTDRPDGVLEPGSDRERSIAMKTIQIATVALLTCLLLILPQAAFAYVGPGAGITAIGAVLALIGGLILAVFGFVWYPIKRLFRAKGKSTASERHPDK